jgi:8-oxo-dGTP diphosphatase
MTRPRTPLLAADVVIELAGPEGPSVVLVRRANPPLGWALPGGFVDIGETVEAAAQREAMEETGLNIHDLELLGVYSDPGRDPRGHTVSAVFICRAQGEPRAGDDAAEVRSYPLAALPPLVFDHARILADYQARKARPGGPHG